MDLNKAMIIGNLTRDPEVRTTPSGQSVANFGLATNRYWTDQAGTKQSAVEYHHIVAWGKLADICAQYLNKGKKVYIEGRLQTRDWEGQDGVKRNRTEIVAENLIMLSGGSGFGGGANRPGAPTNQNTSDEPTIEPLEGPEENSNEEVKVEDLPF